jgi:SAM-dependent methyltransferase
MNSFPHANETNSAAPPNCRICNSSDAEMFIDRAPDYVTNDSFTVVRCRACQSCSTFPLPSDLSRYYPRAYRGYGSLASTVLHSIYRLRVRSWNKMFGRPGRVLEVGCGTGIMLKAFRDAGWIVKGTERTAEAADAGRTQYGLDIVSAGIESLPENDAFDLILLFQVLEHMPDPEAIVRYCFQRLKPDGMLVIGVPNIGSWQAQIGREDWLHLDVPRHLFHFCPASLEFLLRNAGFTQIRIGFVSWEHDPFGWVQTLENRVLPRRNALLRYLSGLDKLDLQAGMAIGLGVALAPLGLVLAMFSWLLNQGALLSATARKSHDTR